MPRKARIDAPGALHHIIIRGIERRKIFYSVKARSLLCYWGVRELGMKTVELAKKVNLAQPTVSQAVSRGKKIAEKQALNLMEQVNQ